MLDSGAGGGDEAGGGRNIMAYGITLLTALIALMPSPPLETQHFAATWLEGPPAA
jgi:hypothetical protein